MASLSNVSHRGIVESDNVNATTDRCPSVTGPLSEVFNADNAASAADPELVPVPTDPVQPGSGSRQCMNACMYVCCM